MLTDERLEKIEDMATALLAEIRGEKTSKRKWYTVNQAAEYLGVTPYTVREWCRNRRINATRRGVGRGKWREWVISHDEIERYERDGLLPARTD